MADRAPRPASTPPRRGAARQTSPDRTPALAPLATDSPSTDTADVDGTISVDGRRLRRQRNRDAVVAALLSLYREGNLDPSAEDVAARSGLSARSVFRYFDDVDDLARAALDQALLDVAHLVPVAAAPADPTATKISALLDERERLWESQANVVVVSRVRAPFNPALAENIAASRLLFRAQVAELFTPELAVLRTTVGAKAAEAAVTALHLLCTFESWHIMRTDHGFDVRRTRATLTAAITALLRAPD